MLTVIYLLLGSALGTYALCGGKLFPWLKSLLLLAGLTIILTVAMLLSGSPWPVWTGSAGARAAEAFLVYILPIAALVIAWLWGLHALEQVSAVNLQSAFLALLFSGALVPELLSNYSFLRTRETEDWMVLVFLFLCASVPLALFLPSFLERKPGAFVCTLQLIFYCWTYYVAGRTALVASGLWTVDRFGLHLTGDAIYAGYYLVLLPAALLGIFFGVLYLFSGISDETLNRRIVGDRPVPKMYELWIALGVSIVSTAVGRLLEEDNLLALLPALMTAQILNVHTEAWLKRGATDSHTEAV